MSLITPIAAANPAKQDGGRGGIRTHGGFPHARFRVECLKPDSATLPQWQEKTSNAQRRTSNLECNSVRHGRSALDVSSVRRNTTSVSVRRWGLRGATCAVRESRQKCYNF